MHFMSNSNRKPSEINSWATFNFNRPFWNDVPRKSNQRAGKWIKTKDVWIVFSNIDTSLFEVYETTLFHFSKANIQPCVCVCVYFLSFFDRESSSTSEKQKQNRSTNNNKTSFHELMCNFFQPLSVFIEA